MIRFGRPEIWLAAVLLAAAAVIVQTAAIAQGASPLAFLEQTYKVYRNSNNNNNSNNAKGIDTSRPELIRRYFAPGLAKAIIRDMAEAKKRGEVPRLNGDPFIDAQDWEIAGLKIEVIPGATRRNATGVVTFTNANEPRKVSLDLIKTGDGWRIYEIKAPSGSLRELFNLN